jgi:hypothetical protein
LVALFITFIGITTSFLLMDREGGTCTIVLFRKPFK